MKELEGAGLVRRPRTHGRYELLFAERLQPLLRDMANLELEIAETRVEALKQQAEAISRTRIRATGSTSRSESA